MAITDLLSYLCAAVAALGNAIANVMQRKAGLEQDPERGFGLRVIGALIRNPTWLLGFGGMVASFVLQAVALGLGQLSAVEPIITLEVPLTLLVAGHVFGTRLGPGEWWSIAAMTAGMVALIGALDPQPGNETNVSNPIYLAAGIGTTGTIVVLIAAAQHGPRIWRTALLGAAAGTSFGFTATLIKETVDRLQHDGLVGMLTTWQTYAAVSFGLLGVVVMQWALHTGPLLASQPGFTLMDPIVSVLWGVLVYNEQTRTGGWLVLATLGMAVLAVGVVGLGRSPLLAAVKVEDEVPQGVGVEGGAEDSPGLHRDGGAVSGHHEGMTAPHPPAG